MINHWFKDCRKRLNGVKREIQAYNTRKMGSIATTIVVLVYLCYGINYMICYDQSLLSFAFAFTSSNQIYLRSNKLISRGNYYSHVLDIFRHSLNSSSNEDLDDDDNKNDKVDTNTAKTYNDNERIGISQLSMIDPILVYADIFAVVIACQLMGLIDVLNDDTFWRNGGWFQPIVIDSSSTLPIFLRRVATDSVCYILTTFVVIRGSYEIHTALRSSHTIFRMMISSILIFTFARLGTIFVQILFDTQGVDINDFVGFFINHSGQIVEILRESYCIALTTTSVRLGLSKFLNLS